MERQSDDESPISESLWKEIVESVGNTAIEDIGPPVDLNTDVVEDAQNDLVDTINLEDVASSEDSDDTTSADSINLKDSDETSSADEEILQGDPDEIKKAYAEILPEHLRETLSRDEVKTENLDETVIINKETFKEIPNEIISENKNITEEDVHKISSVNEDLIQDFNEVLIEYEEFTQKYLSETSSKDEVIIEDLDETNIINKETFKEIPNEIISENKNITEEDVNKINSVNEDLIQKDLNEVLIANEEIIQKDLDKVHIVNEEMNEEDNANINSEDESETTVTEEEDESETTVTEEEYIDWRNASTEDKDYFVSDLYRSVKIIRKAVLRKSPTFPFTKGKRSHMFSFPIAWKYTVWKYINAQNLNFISLINTSLKVLWSPDIFENCKKAFIDEYKPEEDSDTGFVNFSGAIAYLGLHLSDKDLDTNAPDKAKDFILRLLCDALERGTLAESSE